MSDVALSRPLVAFVMFVERWVLSALFLFFSYSHLATLRLLQLAHSASALLPAELMARDQGLATGCDFADWARYGLLSASDLVVALLLLTSRAPSRPPARAAEVFVPMLATFSSLLYNAFSVLPGFLTAPLVPKTWEIPLASVGLGMTMVGGVMALSAMLWLGRSIGIFVSVREVVLAGPYRYVRHPIYLGYAVALPGILLTGCSLKLLLLTLLSLGLLIWRARLEERVLCEQSAPYRQWVERTGFFLPRFRVPVMTPEFCAARERELPEAGLV